MRRALFAALLAAGLHHPVQAELLQCSPEPGRLRAQIDGFGRGEALPGGLDTFRAFIRAGADEYEIYPEHMTASSLKDGVLRVEARRMLSADAAAELVLEGKVAADGGEFEAKIVFRAEGRVMQGAVRCKLL